jgi:Fic family protein
MRMQPFGRSEEGWWSGGSVAGSPGTRVLSGPYEKFQMFVPDGIAGLQVAPPLELARRLAEVEASLARLDGLAEAQALRVLTPLLARQESMASSWIEGFEVEYRRLVQASIHPSEKDDTVRTVLGNVEAMRQAIALGSKQQFEVGHILQLHRALMERAPHPWSTIAGQVRTGLVWIGPRGCTPITAEYVAPPARLVHGLLEDLVAFMNRDDVPTLMQAAIAHAQFETIHPFADGNGRVGRCLIHALLSRHGLGSIVVPVSSAFAADRHAYIGGLTVYQRGEIGQWVRFFIAALDAAADQVALLERDLAELRTIWHDRLRTRGARSDAADWRLLDVLLAQPVVDVATVARSLEVSTPTASAALARLEELGIVGGSDRRWRREWTAMGVIDIMADAELRFHLHTAPEA